MNKKIMKMRMNRNRLIAGLIMVPLLLSGCGSKPAASGAASADAAGGAGAAAQSQAQNGGQSAAGGQGAQAGSRPDRAPMSENEMRLRTISQSLIMLDKTEGLAFTKQQAEQLLPTLEAAVAKKELTAEQQEAVLKVLTADQTKQYQTRAEQMKQRMGGAGGGSNGTPPNGGTMTQEQRDAMKEQRQARAAEGKDGAKAQNPGNGEAGGTSGAGDAAGAGVQGAGRQGNGGKGGPGAGGPGGGGANAGQQLVDLLKARAQ